MEQVFIRNEMPVEIYGGEKLAVERGKGKKRSKLFVAEDSPEDPQAHPEVGMARKGGADLEKPAQPSNSVVFAVNRVRADEASVLGNEKEDETIDEP